MFEPSIPLPVAVDVEVIMLLHVNSLYLFIEVIHQVIFQAAQSVSSVIPDDSNICSAV